MGCGSSTGQQSTAASTASPDRSRQPEAKSGGAKDNDGAAPGAILPADNGSPPGGSHRASRVTVADEAAAAVVPTESEGQQAEPAAEPQPKPQPKPQPPPTQAADDVSSTNGLVGTEAEAQEADDAGWREGLLGELNRQRRSVFSPELDRLDLRPELCAVAKREADRLAELQTTVVSPAVDAKALERAKAGIRCHVMSRVLTKDESRDLHMYLAGLMAGMKAKEEDLLDRDQLADSDASFWTLNGSFGCARATFEITEDADESGDGNGTEPSRQQFAVLVLAFCPESRLVDADADPAQKAKEGGGVCDGDSGRGSRRASQSEAAGDDQKDQQQEKQEQHQEEQEQHQEEQEQHQEEQEQHQEEQEQHQEEQHQEQEQHQEEQHQEEQHQKQEQHQEQQISRAEEAVASAPAAAGAEETPSQQQPRAASPAEEAVAPVDGGAS